MPTYKTIHEWEIGENITTQRILRALVHEESEICKSDDDRFNYVIKFRINQNDPMQLRRSWVRVTKYELMVAYEAAKKYEYFKIVPVKVMAFILGSHMD